MRLAVAVSYESISERNALRFPRVGRDGLGATLRQVEVIGIGAGVVRITIDFTGDDDATFDSSGPE
jgi:hypothetical protein